MYMYLTHRLKLFFDFMEVTSGRHLWDIGLMREVPVGPACLGLETAADSILCGREVCLKILSAGRTSLPAEMGLTCGD